MQVPEHLKAASQIMPDVDTVAASQMTELTGLIGIKTKYNEDVYVGSHTTVWGSFFCKQTKKWGFKCCKTTDKTMVKCAVAAAAKPALLKIK